MSQTPSNNYSTRSSGCPMHQVSSADLTYNDYLKIPELLTLQVPQSKPAHHDEMLFIVIHQAYELWFKLILHELENTIHYMEQNQILRAQHFLNRCVRVMQLLVQQIHILETMSPIEFLEFRDNIAPASGFQSLQYREVEFLAGLKDKKYLEFFKNRPEILEKLTVRLLGPDLKGSYYQLLGRNGFSIPDNASDLEQKGDQDVIKKLLHSMIPIYQKPSDHLPLYLLSETMIEFDEYLSLWREHHVRVVERVIGMKQGTGGSQGVEYLKSTTYKKCFPLLWEVRSHLSKSGLA